MCEVNDSVMKSSSFRSSYGQDEYDHDLPNVVYTASNVPGPGADVEDFDCVFLEGCSCVDGNCEDNTSCSCVAKHGNNYSDGRLLTHKFAGPVVECGNACSCSLSACENRLVQLGPRSGLETYQAPNGKGLGLRTTSTIPQRSFICEYAGEIIGLTEAKHRSTRNTVNYILVLKEHHSRDKVLHTCVDPGSIGNIGRYANHSCDANAAVVPVRFDDPVPRFALFAKREIAAGNEITFDYGDGEVGGTREGKLCFCGERNCRRFLPFNKDLL